MTDKKVYILIPDLNNLGWVIYSENKEIGFTANHFLNGMFDLQSGHSYRLEIEERNETSVTEL